MSKWRVFYGSEQLPHRETRRRVRRALRSLIEPEPKYRTGKFWTD